MGQEQAGADLSESARRHQGEPAARSQAEALLRLALVQRDLGRPDEARIGLERAAKLAREIGGDYETVGWACLTHALKDDREGLRTIDIRTFLEDIEFTQGWREKLLMSALRNDDWRLLMNVESTPDRVQHMMWRFIDKTHPMYNEADAARYGDSVLRVYRRVDQFVGEVLEHLARGVPYKEIADVLSVSIDTVRVHIKGIYGKLHVHSRGEAVAKYLGP